MAESHQQYNDEKSQIQPFSSALLYPDNRNREARVEGLIIMAGSIQDDIKRSADDWEAQDKRLEPTLDRLAKNAGYRTIAEYTESILKILTDEDRAAFQELQNEMIRADRSLSISTYLAAAIGGIGLSAGAAAGAVTIFINIQWTAVMGIRTFALGVSKIVRGLSTEGARLIGIGVKVLSRSFHAAGKTGAKVVKFLKVVAKWLSVAAFLLELATLIAGAIIGAQLRDELRQNITEFASRRFSAKESQLKCNTIKSFQSNATSLLYSYDFLARWVEAGRMTQEEMDIEMKDEFEKVQAQFDIEMLEIDNNRVLRELSELDRLVQAWTREDPNLDQMLKWIEENQEEADRILNGEIELPNVKVAPWNWNPEGIESEKVKALGPHALDYQVFAANNNL